MQEHIVSARAPRQEGQEEVAMIPSNLRRSVFLLSALTIVFSTRMFAQGGGNAAITGTVSDPTGALVPDAKVTVTQESTGVKRSVTTNASGAFNVPSLPPDKYHVTVEAPGFKTYVQNFTLLADQERAIDVRLELGQTSQQVTVDASSVLVNTVTRVLS